MALLEMEEDHYQRVAAAKLGVGELIDNRSLFSHHSSELNLNRDRGSERCQKLLHDCVKSFSTGNTLTATKVLNFCCTGSATTEPTVQYTGPSNPPSKIQVTLPVT